MAASTQVLAGSAAVGAGASAQTVVVVSSATGTSGRMSTRAKREYHVLIPDQVGSTTTTVLASASSQTVTVSSASAGLVTVMVFVTGWPSFLVY
jgi:hypothetical protein